MTKSERSALSHELLRSAIELRNWRVEKLVLHRRSSYGFDAFTSKVMREFVCQEYPHIQGLVEDFRRQNRRRREVCDIYGDLSVLGLKTDPRIEKLKAKRPHEWWDVFHREFPQYCGTVSVSAPGFSGDGAYALIRISSGVGGLHWASHCELFEKVEKGWRKVTTVMMSMA
jgi:hypothetical protein